MAYLTQPDYVKYACSCGQLKPITSLYFCRHCLKIRCSLCVSHEIDSHFCSNCLENMPSSEARLKKNRCCSCFECPSCFHSLSTRARMTQPRDGSVTGSPAGDGSVLENKTPKKLYYLSCFNCRWTSRDVGIPDQPVVSGGWPERASPNATRVHQLMEYYKAVALQEKQDKQERERKKFTIRGKYITLTDKTGLTGAMARNLAGMPSGDSGSSSAIASFVPSQASEEVEGLPDDIYTKDVDLKQTNTESRQALEPSPIHRLKMAAYLSPVTSIPQRLAAPDWQPVTVERLHPLPRALTVKRSQRCRDCDHNITKPEYGPGSIKFKIELLAYYHVPEVKIISCETLKPGCRSSLLLKLSNPTGYEMHLRLMQPEDVPAPAVDEETAADPSAAEKESIKESLSAREGSFLSPSLMSLKEPLPVSKPWERPVSVGSVARLAVPDVSLSLAQRDDAAEYDDEQLTAAPQHEVILWRKSNKMALRLNVTVSEDVQLSQAATLAFAIEYSYRNTVPPSASQPRQPQDHTLYTIVQLDLGIIEA